MAKIDFSKGAASLKSAVSKAGEKISVAAKDGAQVLSEKKQEFADRAQIKNYEAKMKKYNPLFPEKYNDIQFNLPNMVRIVDDAVRKDIDVCVGAIGWMSKEKDVEVLHLYDEAVDFSGLQFLPTPTCDSVYYVDPHDRKTFINVDTYFSNMQQERLAELQHIAFSLGAKEYRVEMIESTSEASSSSASVSAKAHGINAGGDDSRSKNMTTQSQTAASATFGAGRKPVQPTLCWFAKDNNIINLINMRCSENEGDGITSYSFELNSSCAQSMSSATAVKVDAAIKGMGANSKFTSQSEQEHSRKMIFHIDF